MIRLLAVTPPEGPVDPGLVEVWLEASPHEPPAVLLRDPGAPPDATVTGRLAPLAARARDRGLRVLLSCAPSALDEAVRVAVDHGLAGLQLRGDPDEARLEEARARLPDACLGRSVHGAPRGGDAFVDYSCFAPVFAPQTPAPFRKIPVGLEGLGRWTADPRRWVLALGGITPTRASPCLATGAKGVAGISLFFGPAARVAQDVRALRRGLEAMRDVSPERRRR